MKIYCSGIGGIGLSAYASLQRANGHDIAGSDRSDSELLSDLRTQGMRISLDQSGSALEPDTDLFVYSEAIPVDAPERKRAWELGIAQQSYPQAVGEISKRHKLIAVCGTHGKSSTTAMAARLLVQAGMDPTVIVGTKVKELDNRNWRKGESEWFLLEACEYRESFLQYSPEIVLLTTCDGDHFDYFGSEEAYRDAFVRFLRKLPELGPIVTHFSDPQCKEVAERADRPLVNADTQPMLPLRTPGEHMRRNAQLVLSLGTLLGLPEERTQEIVKGYAGSWRRIDVKGDMRNGVTVIDDYGHHPAEIRATLQAIREGYPGRRLVCVFQPHTHDRTRKLYAEFITAFSSANMVVIPDIYVARSDIETEVVDVAKFVADIAKGSGIPAVDGKGLGETETLLRNTLLKAGDVVVCMGAGTITSLASALVKS